MDNPFEETPAKGFSIFSMSENNGIDEVQVSRLGKKITVKGKDGSFQETDSVESNLLFEILRQLKKR